MAMVKHSFFQVSATDAAGYHEFSQTPLLHRFTVTTEGEFQLNFGMNEIADSLNVFQKSVVTGGVI